MVRVMAHSWPDVLQSDWTAAFRRNSKTHKDVLLILSNRQLWPHKMFWHTCGARALKCGGPFSAEHFRTFLNPALISDVAMHGLVGGGGLKSLQNWSAPPPLKWTWAYFAVAAVVKEKLYSGYLDVKHNLLQTVVSPQHFRFLDRGFNWETPTPMPNFMTTPNLILVLQSHEW